MVVGLLVVAHGRETCLQQSLLYAAAAVTTDVVPQALDIFVDVHFVLRRAREAHVRLDLGIVKPVDALLVRQRLHVRGGCVVGFSGRGFAYAERVSEDEVQQLLLAIDRVERGLEGVQAFLFALQRHDVRAALDAGQQALDVGESDFLRDLLCRTRDSSGGHCALAVAPRVWVVVASIVVVLVPGDAKLGRALCVSLVEASALAVEERVPSTEELDDFTEVEHITVPPLHQRAEHAVEQPLCAVVELYMSGAPMYKSATKVRALLYAGYLAREGHVVVLHRLHATVLHAVSIHGGWKHAYATFLSFGSQKHSWVSCVSHFLFSLFKKKSKKDLLQKLLEKKSFLQASLKKALLRRQAMSSCSSEDEEVMVDHFEEPPLLEEQASEEKGGLLQALKYNDVLQRLRHRAPREGETVFVADVVYSSRGHGEIVLLGRQNDGQSVVVHVEGWHPYLLVPMARADADPQMWREELNTVLATHLECMRVNEGIQHLEVISSDARGVFGTKAGACRVHVRLCLGEGDVGRAAACVHARALRSRVESTVCVRLVAVDGREELRLAPGSCHTRNDEDVYGFFIEVQESVDPSRLAQMGEHSRLRNDVEDLLMQTRGGDEDPVLSVEVLPRDMTNLYGYQGGRTMCLMKVTMRTSGLVNLLRDLLEESLGLECVHHQARVVERDGGTRTFNSNVDVVLQFLCDQRAAGCQWVTLCDASPRKSLRLQQGHEDCKEVDVPLAGLRWHSVEEMPGVGPIRVLSFDLEAAGRRGVFPQPTQDPVIQIACQFTLGDHLELQPPVLLCFLCPKKGDRSSFLIDDADVLCFDTEEELLLAFAEVVRAFDADVLTGYNIVNFDLEYLYLRARRLDVGDAFNRRMSRLTTVPLSVREHFFQSAQTGKVKRNQVCMAGRIVLDAFSYLKADNSYRLDSYSLDSVSTHFLGDQKVDLPFTEITPLWHSGADGCRTLGIYCLKDALLPILLMRKLNMLLNVVEMARATGLPANWVLSRGLLIRFMSLLLREAERRGFVVPYVRTKAPEQGRYQGATVLDSMPGMHNWVMVLDFSSMYPSIMRAHNICYSTLASPTTLQPCEEVYVSAGKTHRFVKAEVQVLLLAFLPEPLSIANTVLKTGGGSAGYCEHVDAPPSASQGGCQTCD